MIQLSAALRNAYLNNGGLATLISGVAAGGAGGTGTASLYIFNGTLPANADAALDMSSVHTLLGTVQDYPSGGGGPFGLSFATPVNGIIQKTAIEVWSTGVMAFSGANASASTLQAIFFRLCASGDNGQAAGGGTSYRMQGTIGTDVSFDAVLANVIFAAGGTETLSSFQYQDGNF